MDYALEMRRFIVASKEEYTNDLLAVMEAEAEFMLACLESMEIVDGLDALMEAKQKPSLWEKIKEFFKNLFSVFTNKVNKLTQRDLKWLNEKSTQLKNANIEGITIELLPLWNMSVNKIKNETQNNINRLFKEMTTLQRVAINTPKVKDLAKFSILKKYDKGYGGLEGYKNYLRVGNTSDPKKVKLEGSQLKQLIPVFIDYCMNYEKEIVPFFKSQLSYVERETKAIESKLKSIKESYILVENCNFVDSELKYCNGFEKITEADEKSKDKSTTGVTDITVNKEEKKEEANSNNKNDNGKNNDVKEDYYKNNTKAELKYFNEGLAEIKLTITAAMTVLEEKYVMYMKVLRAIAGETKKEELPNMVEKAKNK